MHVIATAGHVDHGKSALVLALTGADPDRLPDEKRRGLTLDLGFAHTRIGGHMVAFIDVPGHRQFVRTMLAGTGPVPIVLFLVAADEGWMPQSQEHLDVLDALGVSKGVLVISRSDLADPTRVEREASHRIQESSLANIPAVAVSSRTGLGLDRLRGVIAQLLDAQPSADVGGPVRLWVDRRFSVSGSGTVVTGTLASGRITRGDILEVAGFGRVRVRALEMLGARTDCAEPVARVAVNLSGAPVEELSRGSAITSPGRFAQTDRVDVRVRRTRSAAAGEPVLPRAVVVHIGSAAVSADVRILGTRSARLRLRHPLPMHIGDTLVVRDPGLHQVLGSATVLDVMPIALVKRGAARLLATAFEDVAVPLDLPNYVERHGFVLVEDALRAGFSISSVEEASAGGAIQRADRWLLSPRSIESYRSQLMRSIDAGNAERGDSSGIALSAAMKMLCISDASIVRALIEPPLTLREGVIQHEHHLTSYSLDVIGALAGHWDVAPFDPPMNAQFANLSRNELAAAGRQGLITELAEGLYLRGDAAPVAVERLSTLPSPFTVSEARKHLRTSRRVAVPLLELLDARGYTLKLKDGTRRVIRGVRVVDRDH